MPDFPRVVKIEIIVRGAQGSGKTTVLDALQREFGAKTQIRKGHIVVPVEFTYKEETTNE
jgi:uridine kinase